MVFNVDKEGYEALNQLCDIALKVNGLQIMQAIQIILGSIILIDNKEESLDKDK